LKPSRYTGGEFGSIRKPWDSVEARVCLAFPDVYDIGMSHLGYRILYALLNDNPRILAERCYAPWVDLQELLRERRLPLVSLESNAPLRDFDVVGFSLQFELTYTNILSMLDMGGIPLLSRDRGEEVPLVIAGGPVATHAEPVADFFDAMLIGEGEEAFPEVILEWTSGRARGLTRRERLERLATIPGIYVPSLYEVEVEEATGLQVVAKSLSPAAPLPVKRRVVEDLAKFPFPSRGPVGGPEAVFDRLSIEIARGCTEGCRFCQAGMIYRPLREREPQEILDTVLRALEETGQDEVGLTALSTADMSCISPLVRRLVEATAAARVSVSVASLRAYGLSEELLDDMRRVRASGLTFAPEAGTQRMRDVINKNVTEEQLLETAERTFSRGYDKMKLYFILGLPTETDEDVLGIAQVGRNALAVGKRRGKRASVTVSVSVHVPKPHTPFQWCAMDSREQVQRKQALLRDAARGLKGLTLRTHDSEASWLEGILARGDRRLGAVIARAWERGARFDSWDEQFRLDLWQEALTHFGIDTASMLGELPLDARLPWSHLDMGLEPDFLKREHRKALSAKVSPPCGKAFRQVTHHTNSAEAEADPRKLVCYDCGAECDLEDMRRERIVALRRLGSFEPGGRVRLPIATGENLPRAERHRPPQEGTAERWRLQLAKTGPSALLGHLDLMRELPRVIRRAGVGTAYTRGFHPKPDLSFSPALPLGMPSLGEIVDLSLLDAPPAEELLARLRRAAPEGLDFVRAVKLSAQDAGLSRLIDEACYVIGFEPAELERLGGEVGLSRACAELLAKEHAEVQRQVGNATRRVDVRSFIRDLTATRVTELDAAACLSLDLETPVVSVVLALPGQGATRAGEVVEALFGARPAHRAARTALRSSGLSLFDLASLGRGRRGPPPLDPRAGRPLSAQADPEVS